jgi:hypothetical protein
MHALGVVASREHAGINTPSPVVTQQTVRKMGEHIQNALHDPLIQRIAASARTHPDPLSAIWWWVKHAVRFRQDDSLILELFNERDHFELLISPPVLIRMKKPEGDCDDFTMLALALALSAGFRVRIVTVMCDRARPGEYSHVYGEALTSKGWMSLDTSHGTYPGWEVPARDILRKTSWTLDGYVANDERRAA